MRLTILGSGTNVHPTRAASGYLVRTDHTILLDFGPLTLANLLKTGVSRHRITHILFSHYHADHFSDFITYFFDAMIFTKYQGGKRPPLTVIGPRGTKRLFRSLFATLPGFTRAPFAVQFKEVSDRAFAIGDTTVIPRTVTHTQNLHCLGYRIEYGGDVDLAVLDCSFPASQPSPVHLHAGQCGQVAREAGVGQLVLSHLYPITERYNVREQAGEAFGGKIVVGRDLMAIKL